MSVVRGGVIGPHSRLRARIRARTDAYCSRPGLGDGVPCDESPPLSPSRGRWYVRQRDVLSCAPLELSVGRMSLTLSRVAPRGPRVVRRKRSSLYLPDCER